MVTAIVTGVTIVTAIVTCVTMVTYHGKTVP